MAFMKHLLKHAVIGAFAVAIAGVAAADAAEDPANVIKYRQAIMR